MGVGRVTPEHIVTGACWFCDHELIVFGGDLAKADLAMAGRLGRGALNFFGVGCDARPALCC
jgi:hypothetical protein